MSELPPSGAFTGREHRYPVRVYYEDTDFTGVVDHAGEVGVFVVDPHRVTMLAAGEGAGGREFAHPSSSNRPACTDFGAARPRWP